MNIWQRWKFTALHNKALVLTGILVAFSTLFYAGAAIVQVYILKQSAGASTRAAEEIKSTLEATNKQNQEALAKTLAQSREAMAASEKQSKESLDATRNAIQLDQRAWIGVIEAVPPATMDELHRPTFVKEGFPVLLGVVISNSGKSPARKAVSLINTILLPKTAEFSPYYGTPEFAKKLRPGSDVIFPGMRMTQTPTPRAPLNAAEVQIIKSGKSIFYMYGKISYEDVFGKPHWTTFCMFLAPTGDRFYSCPTYNDAD